MHRVLRPGVSGRVLGTMLLPLLLLGIVSVSVTADRHQDALVAERIVSTSEELESLVALRSAMLAERLAEEVTLSGRQPPEEVSRTSEFLSTVLDDPGQVVETTDSALAAVPEDKRPFDADDLARVRANRPPEGDSTALIATRWAPLQAAVVEEMDQSLTQIRTDAVLLGDLELASATDDLDAAIGAPTRSAELLGLLTELWLAPPADRLGLQAQLAAEDARFSATTEQLERSAEPSVRSLWAAQGAMPASITESMEVARSGALGDPGRAVGEPNQIGLSLLEGIDWAIDVDEIPRVATSAVRTMATKAAEEARQEERTTALLTMVAIVASVGAALLFGRSIVAPVRRLTDQATNVGRGDLTLEPLELSGPPEVVRASAAFNDVVDNLVLLERKTRARSRTATSTTRRWPSPCPACSAPRCSVRCGCCRDRSSSDSSSSSAWSTRPPTTLSPAWPTGPSSCRSSATHMSDAAGRATPRARLPWSSSTSTGSRGPTTGTATPSVTNC